MSKIKTALEALSQFGDATFTDVRLVVGQPVFIKTPTGWTPMEYASDGNDAKESVLSEQDFKDFISILDKSAQHELHEEGDLDRALSLNSEWRVRINIFSARAGAAMGMVCRYQPVNPLPFDRTGLPIQLLNMLSERSGLFLVNGRTGAGKTSTLATLIEHINETQAAHIVTIEEPIEYQFAPKLSMITQREVGVDVLTFAAGVRASLRQAPDVIMIGEIRDRDTAEAALRAALSGHLVLASTHGDRAVSAIERMFSYFPDEPGFVALALRSSLIAVVSQVILPTHDNRSFAVAAEMLSGSAEQVQRAISDQDLLKGLEAELLAGRISGSNHFNLHLRQLVLKGRVSAARAAAVSPARAELVKQLSGDGHQVSAEA